MVKHGKTLFTLERHFGKDGYVVWFKMLELLGDTEGHYYDVRQPAERTYLATYCDVDWSRCRQILEMMVDLRAIDKELWAGGIIWCQHFVDGVAQVYTRNRSTAPPERPVHLLEGAELTGGKGEPDPDSTAENDTDEQLPAHSPQENPAYGGLSGGEPQGNRQSKVKQSKPRGLVEGGSGGSRNGAAGAKGRGHGWKSPAPIVSLKSYKTRVKAYFKGLDGKRIRALEERYPAVADMRFELREARQWLYDHADDSDGKGQRQRLGHFVGNWMRGEHRDRAAKGIEQRSGQRGPVDYDTMGQIIKEHGGSTDDWVRREDGFWQRKTN